MKKLLLITGMVFILISCQKQKVTQANEVIAPPPLPTLQFYKSVEITGKDSLVTFYDNLKKPLFYLTYTKGTAVLSFDPTLPRNVASCMLAMYKDCMSSTICAISFASCRGCSVLGWFIGCSTGICKSYAVTLIEKVKKTNIPITIP